MIDESVATQTSHDDVDTWIEMLMGCKQLSEADVKKLCDKVRAEHPQCYKSPECKS